MKTPLLVALFASTLAAQTPRAIVTRVDGAQALSLIAKEVRCADSAERQPAIQGTVNVLVTIGSDGNLRTPQPPKVQRRSGKQPWIASPSGPSALCL